MLRLLKRSTALLLALLSVAVMASCGDQPQNLPADQVIQKAVPAMQAANSFHFTLQTSKIQKPLPGLYVTGVDGDVVKPDKLAGDVTGDYSGVPIKVQVVVDGSSQYMTDPASGKWEAMPPEFNVTQFFDPSKGVTDILSNIKNLSSDGTENVGGTDTYRVKGTVPASALKALSPDVTATGDITSTVWVGTSDFLLRQVQLQGPLIDGEPADIVRTITIKDYNKTVTIQTPAAH